MVTLEQVESLLKSEKVRLKKESANLKEVKQLSRDYEVLADYTNSVLENKLIEVKEQIEPLVNQAYKAIFKQDELRFELNTSIKRYKTIYSVNIKDIVNDNNGLTETFGGAVVVLTSVILRMIFIMLTDKPRFLVLDETLNPISPKYRDKTSEFLSELCNRLDFDILAITFDEGNLFSSSADTIIEAKRKTRKTTIFKQVK